MKWRKLHHISIDERMQVPTVAVMNDRVRIFYTYRTKNNESCGSYFDLKANDLSKVDYVHEFPILEPGPAGSADDAGAMISDVYIHDDEMEIWYAGWSKRTTVPHHTCCMLARFREGILEDRQVWRDRGPSTPLFTTTPWTQHGDYYASGSEWLYMSDRWESVYNIKANDEYFRAKAGECTCRPCVFEDGNMLYCYRPIHHHAGYKIGHAVRYGSVWSRRDDVDILGESSDMQAYPCVFDANGNRYMAYNTDFGESGVHIAILEKD